ncbi:methyl-accepting chemotaxis protein [Acetonema longum]|uniref:Methyl-accepting chemotaxis sensory transducer n=1 Tax=Acetonema longum DSM 6540 TaxID=1009370 RepID=F7NFD0_9FIRM|nr:methyl-accepting chemotaxis protein [Acetonema longum]EGO65255.1 methyl-accepting chemotaxis sensory transducer [Acetonema longum DSM 6540]
MKVNSIQTKFLIILIPLYILSVGILSGISYSISSRALISSMDEAAMALGTDYANRIQFQVRESLVHLEDLAGSPSIKAGKDKDEIIPLMAELQKRTGTFDVIFFMFPDGSGWRSDGSGGMFNRDYLQKAVNTQKSVISNPLITKTTGKLSVAIAVPVMNNGQLTGVIGGAVSLETLSKMVQNLKFKDSGGGFLAEGSGLVIAHSRTELTGKLNLTEKKINEALKLQEPELDDKLIEGFKRAVAEGQQVKGSYISVDGVATFAVFTPVELPGNERWVMIVSAPEREVILEATNLARITLAVSLVFIIVAVLVIVMLGNRLVRPIQRIRDACLLLAEGDLRERESGIQSKDEIGQLAQGFRTMRDNVRTLVLKVQTQVEQIAAASEELSANTEQSENASKQVAATIVEVAQRTDKQQTDVGNTMAIVEEMAAGIRQVVEGNKNVAGAADATVRVTQTGLDAIEQAVAQMTKVGTGTDRVQSAIVNLSQDSTEIGEIVNVMSGIAEQTNLLALNAAIEAARAGEAGRGFAVVAEEVRRLAEQSQEAAKKITLLIGGNQKNIADTVIVMAAGAEDVQAGVAVVNKAGVAFREIYEKVNEVSAQIRDISATIQQMAGGNQQIVDAVRRVDIESRNTGAQTQTVSAATEEQLAAMEEIASSSQALARMAEELQTAVEKFRV